MTAPKALEELVGQLSLREVRLTQHAAELALSLSDGQGLSSLSEESPGGGVRLGVRGVRWDRQLEAWFHAAFENATFTASATVAVVYERTGSHPLSTEIKRQFIERLAVMTAYPYLRAALQQGVSQLGVGRFTLDVLRQGEFRLPGDWVPEGTDGESKP